MKKQLRKALSPEQRQIVFLDANRNSTALTNEQRATLHDMLRKWHTRTLTPAQWRLLHAFTITITRAARRARKNMSAAHSPPWWAESNSTA